MTEESSVRPGPERASVDRTSLGSESAQQWEWTSNSLINRASGRVILWTFAEASPCGRAGDYYECHNQKRPTATLRARPEAMSLIAAAPRVTAALQAIVQGCDDPNPDPNVSLALMLAGILPEARAALRSAVAGSSPSTTDPSPTSGRAPK